MNRTGQITLTDEQRTQAEALRSIGDAKWGDCVILGQIRLEVFGEPDAGQMKMFAIPISTSIAAKIRNLIEKERLKLSAKKPSPATVGKC